MNKIISILCIPILLISACSKPAQEQADLQEKFPNVLNICKIPSDKYNLGAFGFSDMGAWHAYSLPHPDSTKFHGGFSGPLLMKNYGTWLGKSTSRLQLLDSENQIIELKLDSSGLSYVPGKLQQKLVARDLEVTQNLIFTDDRSAMISNKISNKGNKPFEFNWKLISEYFPNGQHIAKKRNGIITSLGDSSFYCYSFADEDFTFSGDSMGLIVNGKNKIILKAGQSVELVHLESYFFNQEEYLAHSENIAKYLQHPDSVFQANTRRWNTYLTKVLSAEIELDKNHEYQNLIVKSVITLVSNWRSPAGALKHNGLFPSAAYQGFYGFWSWDSWKHAVALVEFDEFLAKESIRCMFDYQDSTGMVADCIYFNPLENNWRDTKPPLAAWAVWEIYKKSKDTAFVQEMYPKLQKYHQWWYAYRDINKNGLCEYGSTDGTLIAAKWESGMDNAVRFDNSKLLKNNPLSWSMDQESVDLNVFLQKEKEFLANLAHVVGNQDESQKFLADSKTLAAKIQSHFWSKELNYFCDFNFKTGKLIEIYGPEGWLALWTGLATKEQAVHLRDKMMDSSNFNTWIPLPTLDKSHPKFNPMKGYWRGPVWLDQFWFGVEGLQNYGYSADAKILKLKLLRNAEGLLSDEPIRENYHPLTGQGLNAEHFSWSAAHLLLLLTKN